MELGGWLLNGKLLHKRLDVRIKGTMTTAFYNGRYENQCGYVVLESIPSSTASSVTVRVGFEQSRRSFKLFYLFPELTTENPGFVSREAAHPVVSSMGQRVVIIGPDLTGNTEFIGNHSQIIQSHYELQPTDALVLLWVHGSQAAYFNEKSLCRSLQTH
jgi:hypothetical protein